VYHVALCTERKRKGKDNSDLIEKLVKLDEEAAKRSEEQTRKWLEMEEERKMRRLHMEQQHEERMMSMFGTLNGQLSSPAAPYMGYQCNTFPYELFTEYPAFDHSSTSISHCSSLQVMWY